MVVGEGNQNLTKACHGIHVVLCTLYMISFGKLMAYVKYDKNARDSNGWFRDFSGFNNEFAFSSGCNSSTY